MKTLKHICLTLLQIVKQVFSLPQRIAVALKQRRGHVTLNALESERLDRIRNPSKYLGK